MFARAAFRLLRTPSPRCPAAEARLLSALGLRPAASCGRHWGAASASLRRQAVAAPRTCAFSSTGGGFPPELLSKKCSTCGSTLELDTKGVLATEDQQLRFSLFCPSCVKYFIVPALNINTAVSDASTDRPMSTPPTSSHVLPGPTHEQKRLPQSTSKGEGAISVAARKSCGLWCILQATTVQTAFFVPGKTSKGGDSNQKQDNETFESSFAQAPRSIYSEMNTVIGQDGVKKVLSVSVYNHYQWIKYRQKRLRKKRGLDPNKHRSQQTQR